MEGRPQSASKMRRIVYFSLPAHGHINPTLPVVRELVRRKQQVVYYSTEQFRQAIQDTGALFFPYCTRFCMPEQGPGPFAQVSTTLETLLDLSRAVLECHLEQARMLRPTHVMYDSFAPWGRFVAQILRLPSVASIPSILVNSDIDARYGQVPGKPPEDPRLTPQWYAEFQTRCASLLIYGLSKPPSPPQLLQSYGDFNMVYTSRFFQPSGETFDERCFKFVGPCLEFRVEDPPFPYERLDGRPLVLISLGTVYGNHPEFFRKCLEELADTPWQIVVSTGGNCSIAHLGQLPDNFIVRSFVPQLELLRRCTAFVTHAGMNSVQEALYYGVPLVMAPRAADQFWISARAAELGAGLVLALPAMAAGAIRGSVVKILLSKRYADAAARVGASLRAEGGHMRAVDEIERFIRCTARSSTWPL